MILKKTTAEQVRNSTASEYNSLEWERKIRMYESKMDDVQWFNIIGQPSERFAVEYTTPDGIRLISEFDYMSSLTSGGFYRADMAPITDDGFTHKDFVELWKSGKHEEAADINIRLNKTDLFKLSFGKFKAPDGKLYCIGTTEEARQCMRDKSKFGIVFSKGF